MHLSFHFSICLFLDSNCDYRIDWFSRSDEVDFRLSGRTQGYVAIAFSEDIKMGTDRLARHLWAPGQTVIADWALTSKYSRFYESNGTRFSRSVSFIKSKKKPKSFSLSSISMASQMVLKARVSLC